MYVCVVFVIGVVYCECDDVFDCEGVVVGWWCWWWCVDVDDVV